jgi:hypothetical protein
MNNYTKLNGEYQKLLRAFNEPLPYKLTPTIQELQYWLTYEDDTDKIIYEYPNFVCGDFAVMLSQHAKLKYWDMTIVLVFGYNQTGYRFDHAFNAIICQEGLVYVEPQTDNVFWYGNHEKIVKGAWYEFPDYEWVYVENYFEVLWYD